MLTPTPANPVNQPTNQPTNQPKPQTSNDESREKTAVLFAWGCIGLGVLCAVVIKLSIPAMMLTLIAFLTLPKNAKLTRLGLVIAIPFIASGLVRFTIEEAAPGVIEGGKRAVARGAIAHMRDIVFAQDIARQQAFVDKDKDGVGSAVSLWSLAGHDAARGERKTPRLLERFKHKVIGKDANVPGAELVIFDGYIFAVFIPAKNDSAWMGSQATQASVDEEKAETRYVAYAWPFERGHAEHTVLFIDEHERILVSENDGEHQSYFGLHHLPSFDAAFAAKGWDAPPAVTGIAIKNGGGSDEGTGADGGLWKRWRDKEARAQLPGAPLRGETQ